MVGSGDGYQSVSVTYTALDLAGPIKPPGDPQRHGLGDLVEQGFAFPRVFTAMH